MERKGNVKISDGGPISGKCAEFDGKSYLMAGSGARGGGAAASDFRCALKEEKRP